MELKDVLKLVGVEESDELTIDQVKKQLESKYLDKATAHENQDVQKKIIGKHFNVLRQGMVNSFGVEEDFIKNEDGEYIEPVDAFKKIAEKLNTDIAEIKKNASEGTDKRVNTLTEKLEKTQNSLKDLTTMNKDLNSQLDEVKQNATNEITKFKVTSRLTDIKSTFKVMPDLAPALKRGIDSEIVEDYSWSLDEEGKLQVRDKDGGIVPSTEKASTPATPQEVLKSIYEKNGALVKNGAVNKQVQRFEKKDKEDGVVIQKRRQPNPG